MNHGHLNLNQILEPLTTWLDSGSPENCQVSGKATYSLENQILFLKNIRKYNIFLIIISSSERLFSILLDQFKR